jgi:hypothetical protein
MIKYKQINHTENAFVENHEVVSMFFSHVHWMLEQQRLTRRKFIDVPSWEEFRDSPSDDFEEYDYDVDLDVEMADVSTSRLTRSAKKASALSFSVLVFKVTFASVPTPVFSNGIF